MTVKSSSRMNHHRKIAIYASALCAVLTIEATSGLTTTALRVRTCLPRMQGMALTPPCFSARAFGPSDSNHGPHYSKSLFSSPSDTNNNDDKTSKLDSLLSRLTSAFPLFVLGSALLAIARPQTLLWVNQGNYISVMLATVMTGTGLTLTPKDFEAVFDKKNIISVPLGVVCQFGIMPLAAGLVGHAMFLQHMATAHQLPLAARQALFLGLCLVGCSPGGTASNLVSLIAKADVALSVVLTACSTLLAVVATPALVKLLVGSNISVSGMALVQVTAKVVLAPVLLGMLLNKTAPKLSRGLSRFTPFMSVVLVSLICGGVVAQTVPLLTSTAAGGAAVAKQVALAVASVHTLGFAAGYIIPKFGFARSETTSRTISIEVGMQNSALAVVLARSLGAPPLASLPGALSATAHSCLGSMLAAYWRLKGDFTSKSDLEKHAGDNI
jgi:bile acid:Na+ symporter, BASS family